MPQTNVAIRSAAEAIAAGKIPTRLHHNAYVTRDQEATRHFYEDVIGLPLVATWAEGHDDNAFCHTFFALADGGALAFFQYANADAPSNAEFDMPATAGRHIAMNCDEETQEGILERLNAGGYSSRMMDHGYCKSLYVTDPNGLRLEFTLDHPEAKKIDQEQRASAHEDLKKWLSGDHKTNNTYRPGSF